MATPHVSGDVRRCPLPGTAGRHFIMHRGYIKIWRKITEWEWFKDSNTFHLFSYMLIYANHKDTRFMGHEIKRGELVFGRNKASEDLRISPMKIRTCVKHLKDCGEITQKVTNKFSIITICNYNKYQDQEIEINQQLTSNQPATNQQLTTSKECKNIRIKEYKEKKPFIPPLIEEVKEYFKENSYPETLAEKFWKSYSVSNWIDSRGNSVKNWKQKALQVWFREENKIKTTTYQRPSLEDIL